MPVGRAIHRRTERLAVLTAVLLPVQFGDVPVAPSDVLLLVCLCTLLPIVPSIPRPARIGCGLLFVGMLLAFVVTMAGEDATAMAWAPVRMVGLAILLTYLGVFGFVLRSSPRLGQECARALVLSTAAVNVLLLPGAPTRALVASALPQKFDSRISGGLYDPNANGALLAVCVVVLIFAPRGYISTSRLVRSALLLICLVSLVLTLSRGAAVACAVGIVVGCAAQIRRRPDISARLVAAAIASLAVASVLGVFDWVQTQLAARPDSSLSNRFLYIDRAVEAFAGSALVGGGLGNATSSEGAVTHATFFWLLGDTGVLGAAGYVMLFGACFRRALSCRDRPNGRAALVSLSVMLVCSFSFEAMYQRHLWFIFAMALTVPPRTAPTPSLDAPPVPHRADPVSENAGGGARNWQR